MAFFILKHAKNSKKNDYINMRIITDDLYTKLVKILLQDEKVAIFQELILSQKAEPTENKDEVKSEVKK